ADPRLPPSGTQRDRLLGRAGRLSGVASPRRRRARDRGRGPDRRGNGGVRHVDLAASMSEFVLAAVAAGALVWIVVPVVLFSLGLTRLRNSVRPDPADAEPRADDPDYERRFRQFAELGFRPVGSSRESCWFMNPGKWYWRSFARSRWMAMP